MLGTLADISASATMKLGERLWKRFGFARLLRRPITGLPCKKGQYVEMILLIEPQAMPRRPHLTGHRLLHSELIGLWKDRKDIEDSAAYARQLREQTQRRQGLGNDKGESIPGYNRLEFQAFGQGECMTGGKFGQCAEGL